MQLNLAGVQQCASPDTYGRTPPSMGSPYKPLNPNIIQVKSNSIHYKIVKEPFPEENNASPHKTRLVNNIAPHKIGVSLERHHHNASALTAIENAQYESHGARERTSHKGVKVDTFLAQTQKNVIDYQRKQKETAEQINRETAMKIKKLLSDTIEFSQKTNLNAGNKYITETTENALNPGVASGFKKRSDGRATQSPMEGHPGDDTHSTVSNAIDLGHKKLNEA
jgi:hypothetical protein